VPWVTSSPQADCVNLFMRGTFVPVDELRVLIRSGMLLLVLATVQRRHKNYFVACL